MTVAREQVSMLSVVHAALFTLGIMTFLAGIALRVPALLTVSGPCLASSGALIWVGSRITLAGPLGDALRLALGRTRLVTIRIRAVLWVVIGVLVTLLGIQGLQRSPEDMPEQGAPLAREDEVE